MAPRSRPCDVMEGDDIPFIRAQIQPYCIAQGKKHEWEKAQKILWRKGAIDEVDLQVFANLLKLEILNAL